MKNEILKSPEEIKQETGDLRFKVSAIQAKKNEDIAKRILEMDTRRNETRNLTGLLKEAEENLNYYKELEETGQLPEDERENFSEAEELVLQVKAKMVEHNEAAEKIMTIPDVGGKIMEEAGEMNKEYNEKEAGRQKEKIMEEKFYQWFEKVISLAGKFNQEYNLKLDELGEAEENLTKKIDETIPVEWAKREIKETMNNIEQFEDRFSDKIEEYKKDLGLLGLFKKIKVNSLVNSNELGQMRAAIENLNKFLEDNDFKRGGYIDRELRGCVYAILYENNKGMTQELNDLFNLCDERPEVPAKYLMRKAYEKGGNRFEEARLAPDNIDSFRKKFAENSRREEQKK